MHRFFFIQDQSDHCLLIKFPAQKYNFFQMLWQRAMREHEKYQPVTVWSLLLQVNMTQWNCEFSELGRTRKFSLKCSWSLKDSVAQISEHGLINQCLSAGRVLVQNDKIQNLPFPTVAAIKCRANYIEDIYSLCLHPFLLRHRDIPIGLIFFERMTISSLLMLSPGILGWVLGISALLTRQNWWVVCSVTLFPGVFLVLPGVYTWLPGGRSRDFLSDTIAQ